MPDDNWPIIASLSSSVRHGGAGLDHVPPLLRDTIENGRWRWFITGSNALVEYAEDEFDKFLSTEPEAGLGSTPEMVRRIVAGDPDLAERLDELLPPGESLVLLRATTPEGMAAELRARLDAATIRKLAAALAEGEAALRDVDG